MAYRWHRRSMIIWVSAWCFSSYMQLLLFLYIALHYEARRVADIPRYRQIDQRARTYVIASVPLTCQQNDWYAPCKTYYTCSPWNAPGVSNHYAHVRLDVRPECTALCTAASLFIYSTTQPPKQLLAKRLSYNAGDYLFSKDKMAKQSSVNFRVCVRGDTCIISALGRRAWLSRRRLKPKPSNHKLTILDTNTWTFRLN